MDNKGSPAFASNELFDYIAKNQRVLSAHGNWLSAGGEKLLELAERSVRGDLFPWSAEQHVQASFGAFCAGAAWMSRLLRNLVALTNDRGEALRMLIQADGQIGDETRKILLEQWGYSEAELAKYENKTKRRGDPARK